VDLRQDWSYIVKVSDQRRRNNRTPWHINEHYLEVIGTAGELASRRFLGLPEELHTHFDGGTDLIWKGYRVDVKTTILTPNIEFRFLQWPIRKTIKSDIVLMMAVDEHEKTATPIGWVFAFEVMAAVVNQKRDHPCHEISVRDLRPSWELFSLRTLSRKEQRAMKQFVTP
jgi:hypothetical protein